MSERPEMIPTLDPGASALLEAYKAQTARSPAQVEAALQQATHPVSAPAAGTTAGSSIAVKGLVAAVVLGAGVWAAWPSRGPEAPVSKSMTADVEPVVRPPAPAISTPVVESPLAVDAAPVVQPPAPVDGAPTGEPLPDAAAVVAVPEPERLEVAPAPVATPAPASAKPRRAPARKRVDDPPRPSLADELRRLKQVRADLRAGRAREALAGIDQHRRLYPDSAFAEERDATEVTALCALGRTKQAQQRAIDFERRFARSRHDVLASCDP